MAMKLLKDWEKVEGFTYEEINKKVYKVFSSWERRNLEIIHGSRNRNTEYTYGLPYTSSGDFASLGLHCNVEAVLKTDKNFVAYELAINADLEIVVYLTDAEENEKFVVIGKLK